MVCGILHLLLLVVFVGWPWWYGVFWMSGIATSLWNHGTTCTTARNLDRAMMAMGVVVDFCQPANRSLVLLAVASYLLSKHRASLPLHILSHLLATAAHASLLLHQKT
jgi:hypothetical protein